MNYYLPYQMSYLEPAKTGLFSKILKNGINWSSFLSNTQKTLNIINQTIPVIKQMGPVINNTKTMFKLMNEFKKVDAPKTNIPKKITEQKKSQNSYQNINNPTFFQ